MKKNHLLRTMLAVFAALFVIIQTIMPVKAEAPSVKAEKTVYYLRMGESVTGKYTVKGSGKVTVHPAEELYGGETKICTVSQGSGTYTIKASKDKYGTARIPISIEGGNEEVILVHVYQDDMFYLKYLPEEINVLASNEILYLFPEYAPHSSSEMPVTITSSDDSIAQPRLSVMPLAEMAITLKKAGTVTVTFKAKTFERTMKLTVLPEGDYAQSVSEKNGDGFIYLKAGEKIKNPFIMKSDEGTCKDDKVKVSYLYGNQSDIVKIGSDGSLTGVTQGYAEIIGTSLLGGRSYVTVCVYNAPEKLAVTDGPFYVNQYNRFDKHPIIYSVPGQESDLPLVLTSSNPKAVKINEGRSMEYVAPGTAVIRAAYEKDPKVYVEFKVTAYKAKEPDSIKVAKEVTLYPGFGLILNPEFSPARSLESFTEAKSSDSSVADVMAMENGLMLSGYKKGTATITLKAGSKAKATIKVTVKDGKPDCKKHVTVQSLKDYPYYSAARTKEITDSKEVIFIKDDMYSFYAEADFAPYVCLGGSDQIGVDFSKVIENTGLFVYMGDDMLSA
ncbi:MAG: hypothetical protein K6A40_01225, partial [Solobacterium sp.]|nr:hypothetical protein [Solobacterium sp.]